MSYCVVIPAAGSGTRMGAAVPKVLLKPAVDQAREGLSILAQTVRVFSDDAECASIVVCAPAEWRGSFASELSGLPGVVIIEGGASRQASVWRGVEELERRGVLQPDSVVLVHDAARCCLTREVIERVLDGVQCHGAVTAAVPVVDSLCRAEDGRVVGYVDRSQAWAIQTPQGFFAEDLLRAHREAAQQGIEALDDAALVARIRPVHVVHGDRFNIKVTQPGDLAVAERIGASG